MKEKIVSTKIIDSTTTEVTLESGIKIDCWHETNKHPKVGEFKDVDDCLNPFLSGTYDLRTRDHRSPFYKR